MQKQKYINNEKIIFCYVKPENTINIVVSGQTYKPTIV